MNKKRLLLSYVLQNDLSAYWNGERIDIKKNRDINKWDTSNNSKLILNSHFWTHIDFPRHFSQNAKTWDQYIPTDFIFKNIAILDISKEKIDNYIIKHKNINLKEIDKNTNFLIIKTWFYKIRYKKRYWKYNRWFAPETAKHIKEALPNIKAIGFDLISLSSYQNRQLWRLAHKKFLIENNILIIEDMNLSELHNKARLKQLIISPLYFKNSDGSPVTIFAKT